MAAIFFTSFQCLWALWWAWLHVKIRRKRKYTMGRRHVASDKTYRTLSPILYLMQNAICVASVWSNSEWLIKFHDSDTWRVGGVVLFSFGSFLYWWALKHLGSNYSPCYDSHAPNAIVVTGPYQWIRHPMYAGKLFIGLATVILSGSLWFVPTTLYFFVATLRALAREEVQLRRSLVGYSDYQRKTARLFPGF